MYLNLSTNSSLVGIANRTQPKEGNTSAGHNKSQKHCSNCGWRIRPWPLSWHRVDSAAGQAVLSRWDMLPEILCKYEDKTLRDLSVTATTAADNVAEARYVEYSEIEHSLTTVTSHTKHVVSQNRDQNWFECWTWMPSNCLAPGIDETTVSQCGHRRASIVALLLSGFIK